jgi:hypothetical protein
MPVSGRVAIVMSFIPAWFNGELHVVTRLLAGFRIFISFLSTTIMLNVQIWKPNNINYYGKWLITGGSCPRVVGDIKGWACAEQYYVGCGVEGWSLGINLQQPPIIRHCTPVKSFYAFTI